MKACPPFHELNALIDADLPSEKELTVRLHLDLCAACRQRVDGLNALKRVVGSAYGGGAPSTALRRAVAAGLAKRHRSWWSWIVAAPLAFAAGTVPFSVVGS